MKSCPDYIAEAKYALGNARMSDRELGERLGGYSTSNVSRARYGYMADTMAVAVAKAIGIHPGEVLAVARAERENNEEIKGYLIDYVKKSEALVPKEPVPAPELVVLRGGMRALSRTDEQGWRKRSLSTTRPMRSQVPLFH